MVNQEVWVEFSSQEIFENKSNTRASLKYKIKMQVNFYQFSNADPAQVLRSLPGNVMLQEKNLT